MLEEFRVVRTSSRPPLESCHPSKSGPELLPWSLASFSPWNSRCETRLWPEEARCNRRIVGFGLSIGISSLPLTSHV